MTEEGKKYAGLIVLGVLIFIVFLLITGVKFSEIYGIFIYSRKEYYILAIIADIGFMGFYATAWYFLVKIVLKKIRYRDAVIATLIGWFGDMVIPAAFITGELIRLYYLKRIYGLEFSKGIATVIVHRLLSAVAFVSYITLGALYIFLKYQKISRDIFIQVAFFAFLGILVALFGLLIILKIELFEKWGIKFFDYVSKNLRKFKLERYRKHIEDGLYSFRLSVDLIKENSINVAIGFLFLMTQWTCGILVPYIFFMSVKHPVSFWILALAFPIYGVIDNMPIGIPVMAGIFETFMVSTFILLGISKEIAVAVTLLTRSILVVFEAIFTGAITFIYAPKIFGEIEIKTVKQKLMEIRTSIIEKDRR